MVAAFAPKVFLDWLYYTTDESELSLRCAERGWRTLYLPEALALHKGGRSTKKNIQMATLMSMRNWAYIATRYVKPRAALVFVWCQLAVSVVGQLLRRRWGGAAALVRGAFAGCAYSKTLHAARKRPDNNKAYR